METMTVPEIEKGTIEKVKEILERTEDIRTDDDLSQFGLDSLASVNLVVEIEELFDIVIEDEELLVENFSTVNKIVELVLNKVGSS